MSSYQQAKEIAEKLNKEVIAQLFQGRAEILLFGSYARGDAEWGSDIDLMILVDASRAEIAEKTWQIGDAVAGLLLEYGIVISPIVENKEFYRQNRSVLPLFRNIEQEGVQLIA